MTDPGTSNTSPLAETAEPFLVVRPKKFTLEERSVAIRTIIGGDNVSDRGNT